MPLTLTCDWQMSDGTVKICPHHHAGEKCGGDACSLLVPCHVAIYADGIRMWVGQLLYAELVKNGTILEDDDGANE